MWVGGGGAFHQNMCFLSPIIIDEEKRKNNKTAMNLQAKLVRCEILSEIGYNSFTPTDLSSNHDSASSNVPR